MVLVMTTKEIACSPAHLRNIFLDFSRYAEWSHSFMKSIETQSQKPTIEPGDALNVKLEGMSFSPVVLENSRTQFMWRGSIPYLLKGDHFFRFEESKTSPGSTTFSH